MSAPSPPPCPEDGLALHRRLCEGDPAAWGDLARAYLPDLVAWLVGINRCLPEEYCVEAAEDALVALVNDPHSYNPARQDLLVYLRYSARGDLLNILRREGRHGRRRRSLDSVELSPDAGKYLGREDDPSLRLRIAEEEDAVRSSVPGSVRDGLSEGEGRVLELLLSGERRTGAFAEAYGVTDLPKGEQEREVKRVKDRLKKRLGRAGGDRD